MGRFIYGNNQAKTEIEDRTLAHLQHVMGTKLRRGESFFFTWREDVSVGDGRHAVWIHHAANIEFKYHGHREPQLSRAWLEALNKVASSSTGLYIVREPAVGAQASKTARPVEAMAS